MSEREGDETGERGGRNEEGGRRMSEGREEVGSHIKQAPRVRTSAHKLEAVLA